jgi:hypothetical protein
LGDRIVRDLALDESTDTVGRWMAHRVAELIDAAKKARGNAARARAAADATDLILRLWAHRSNWPKGWPPESAVKILAALDRDSYRRESAPSGSPWLDALSRLADVQTSERRLWFGVSLFDFDLRAEIDALEDESTDLTDEERTVLEGLVRERDWVTRKVFDGAVPRSKGRRAETAQSHLAALQTAREALIAEVLQAVRKPSRKGETDRRKRAGVPDRKTSGKVSKKSARPPRARRRGPGA